MSSHFTDKAALPDDAALAEALGPSKPSWDALYAEITAIAGVKMEWKHYGGKHGWQVKAVRKRKALAYLIPHDGSFLAGMALNDAALEALRDGDLPAAFVEEIAAKRYPEGWPGRVEVRGDADLATVRALLAAKLAS